MGQLHGNLTFKPSIKIDAASIYGSPNKTRFQRRSGAITGPMPAGSEARDEDAAPNDSINSSRASVAAGEGARCRMCSR